MRDERSGPAPGLPTRRTFLRAASGVAMTAAGLGRGLAAEGGKKPPEFGFNRTSEALQLNFGQRPILRYQLTKPASGGSAAESACYFHPVSTPSGLVVTDAGPEDHPHHRGIFTGFVEVRGPVKGDFWGWGEPAPTQGRKIVNQSLESPPPALGSARFRALNDWQADGRRIIREDLRASIGFHDGATLIDLAMQLSVESDVTLGRWAFGGFAVRTRKDGERMAIGPEGRVTLPPPKHTDPASNWPDVQWYGMHLKLTDGKQATVVVVNRGSNPKSTWHVVPGIGLLNPCITAPSEITITQAKPLVLRYRILLFDGVPKPGVIKGLADIFYHAGEPA